MKCKPTRAARMLAAGVAAVLAAGGQARPASARSTPAWPADPAGRPQTLYVETNDPRPGQNAVLAYRIGAGGALSPLPGSPFRTGGTGFFDPSLKLGPFDNDQQVVVAPTDTLYAVNGGSNTIAALHVGRDGSLSPLLGWPTGSRGSTPVSIGLRDDGALAVVNSAEDPAQAASGAQPSLSLIQTLPGGFPLLGFGARLDLPAGSDPTQALTTHTGRFIFTTGFPGGGMIGSFARSPDGRLARLDAVAPPAVDGTAALPLGLAAHPRLPYLYAGLVNVNHLGVYRWDGAGRLALVRVVPNAGQALCWLRTTRDGRYLLTVNTGDQSLSVYDLADPSNPVETQHVAVGGSGGLEEFSLSPDERMVYVLEQQNSAASAGGSNKIHALSFDPGSGRLAALDQLTVSLPVGAGVRPLGLAIR